MATITAITLKRFLSMETLIFFLLLFNTIHHNRASQFITKFRVMSTIRDVRSDIAAHCRASSRRVTFGLPEDALAGGFGDRLLGMVTTQYLSLMTSSALYVNWTRPYDLWQYFHVSDCTAELQQARLNRTKVNRTSLIDEIDSKVIPAVDTWAYFIDGAWANNSNTDITVMTNGRHWFDIVKASTSQTRARVLRLDALSRQQLFKVGVDALLQPRNVVIDAARVVQKRLAAPSTYIAAAPFKQPWYVGVQLRCGSHGALTWSDPERHSLADIPCFVRETVVACAGRSVCPIFLTADSSTASDAFRAALVNSELSNAVIVEAEGPVLHTDRTNATAAAATGASDPWLRSIVDWWLLKHASKLVISRSGFGETAAWASATGALARRVELGRPGACHVTNFDTLSLF